MICFLWVNLYGLPLPCPKGHALLRAVVVERCCASLAGLYGESGDASLLPCHVDDEASPCTEATETAVAPGIGQARKKMDVRRRRLQKHLSDAGTAPEVTVPTLLPMNEEGGVQWAGSIIR